MPASWIHKLNESNSRIHKEKVINQALIAARIGDVSAENFLLGAYSAYNPFFTYNIKQIPTTSGIVDAKNNWQEFWNLLLALKSRKLTGHAAVHAVEKTSQQFDSEQWNNFAKSVIAKDLRVGATLKTFNKILKGTNYEIPVFECQLASDSNKHPGKMKGRKIIQRKLDGVRAITIVYPNSEDATIYSRNGKEFFNFPHIVKAIRTEAKKFYQQQSLSGDPTIVLDGEIISENFQALMKQAHRKTNVDTSDSVYHIFDIMLLDDFKKGISKHTQLERAQKLKNLKINSSVLKIEDYIVVDLDSTEGKDIMRRYAEDAVNAGFEGIMIKDKKSPYECKRGSHWLKWKPFITVDLTVVAVEEGTGRNENRLGALVCEGVDNEQPIKVNVGSGFTDDDRVDFWNNRNSVIDSIVEVRADAVTQNQDGTYSLRFPRFVRFRNFDTEDKM